ncbi:MAG: N-acetyltransferase [Phycisphaeraceae bacterium]
MTIRPATVADVPAAARIINDCAEYGLMLPRSLASLYEKVRDYHVAELAGRSDDVARIVGVGGLSIMWANLAEVYALAVDPAMRGRGLGRRLVEACIDNARQLGIRNVMTLTYEQAFFERLGFSVVDRARLPLKVWSECLRCPKNQACDEIAMMRELTDVPALASPRPEAPPADAYIVPVTLTALGRRGRASDEPR